MTGKSFKDWASMNDKALAAYIGAFARYHRMEQNKTQDELSAAAGISRSTLSLLERAKRLQLPRLYRC